MSFKNIERVISKRVTDVLGDSVTYSHSAGGTSTIKAVFDNAYIESNGTMSLRPILQITLADLSTEPAKGDRVTIDSVVYRVQESRPDGYGGSTLILQRV